MQQGTAITRRGPKRWAVAPYIMIGVILMMAQASSGQIIVGSDPLPMPSDTWPSAYGQWGTDYSGTSTGNWVDESGTTTFEGEYDLTHSYDPLTQELFIDNAQDLEQVKNVWVELIFAQNGTYPATRGAPANPAEWASISAVSDDPNMTISLTGASWRKIGPGLLSIWQSWTIDPQPYYETIDLSNIIANAGGANGLLSIKAQTACVPEPATLALLSLGGIGLIRRRR